ncbi:hypothetical protein BDN70DRAFT_441858 [Pholiota conissans]|uniref:DUF6533 domain-containing protein n=1 Tax=Pholiota conissans TaxID=109636 RepID=A0A9P5YRP8_9AGAR|nr:hypothetical protein BDN70DRAFT_441858 [Pholiota conissans]
MFLPSANIGPLDTLHIPGPLSISAFVVQVWELGLHWSDELEYLWKGRFNFIKALYFFSRYVLLVAQFVSEIITYKMLNREQTVEGCIHVFTYKVIMAQLTLTVVETILLIRVYALYNQSFQVKRFLAIVFLIAQTLEIWATGRIVGHLLHTTDCKPPAANSSTLVQFGVGASLCQLVIFVLSLFKLLTRWSSRTPLTSLMIKEGVAAFLLIVGELKSFIFLKQCRFGASVLLVVMMSYYQVFRRFDLDLGNAAFAWYIALMSAGASRLILNMRRLAVKSRRRRQIRHLSLYNEIDSAALEDSLYDSDDTICLTTFYE